jgi:hypothetical protein
MKMLSAEERALLEAVSVLCPATEPRDATPREDAVLFGLLASGRISAIRPRPDRKQIPRITAMGQKALQVHALLRERGWQ